MSENPPLTAGSGRHVELELISDSGEVDRLSLDIVPDAAADFAAGFLGENTPLARAVTGHAAGALLPYRAGDSASVRILAVEESLRSRPKDLTQRREETTRKAVEDSERISTIIFASSVNNKWGDYDPAALVETDEGLGPGDFSSGARRPEQLLRRLVQQFPADLEAWSRALDARSREGEGHTLRVTQMSVELARLMGLQGTELEQARLGALLHDIGKMNVSDGILLKTGPLSEDEWAVVKKHPAYASDLLASVELPGAAAEIAYCHHEKWDGSGYPRGLRGEQIPLAARVFAVVDVYDALTSERPFRPAWSREEALDYLRGLAGIEFDARVIEAFFKLVG